MQKNGIDVEICQIRISEIESNLEGTDLRDWRGSDRSKDAGSIKEMIREV